VATLSTNIAANVVAPANSFSNAFPKWVSFRTGGIAAAVIGILICPWLIMDELIGFLVSYSGLLGAVGGVLIADYWLLRRTWLDPQALYSSTGAYRYGNGVNWKGVGAMAAGIAVVLLGKAHPALEFLFQGAWFSAFATSLLVYVVLMRAEIEDAAPENADE
jgi:NCS1 family nucleobase:cation symporter-1